MSKHTILNELYEPMYLKAKSIYKELSPSYKVSLGWFNMHSKRVEDGYITQYFPIPIISIEKIGDIGIDLDSIFFEVTVSREKALELDYDLIINEFNIEVYGAEDYLTDYYNEQMKVEDIYRRIIASDETQMHINVIFSLDVNVNNIMSFWEQLIDEC